jgi:ATP-dependent Zn protease
MVGETIDYWLERAGEFVEENWSAIEAIASALLEREKLDGIEIAEIINGT